MGAKLIGKVQIMPRAMPMTFCSVASETVDIKAAGIPY